MARRPPAPPRGGARTRPAGAPGERRPGARLRVEVPGARAVEARWLLLDLNGTLAEGGRLRAGVPGRLRRLARRIAVQVLTADTFGTAARALRSLPVELRTVRTGRDKARLCRALAREGAVAVGNGRNDAGMLAAAALSIAVLGPEGMAAGLWRRADVVVARVEDALDLLRDPRRLRATLRP